jgi:hypothetical protein
MTKTGADDAWADYIKGGKYPDIDVLNEICAAWNQGDLKTNFMGGIGYRVRNGRIVRNNKEHTQNMVTA